jgi:hypothetical protein
LPPEPAGFGYGRTVDIPLDRPGSGAQDLKKKEKELQAKEADLRRREQDLKRKQDAAARGKTSTSFQHRGFEFSVTYDICLCLLIHSLASISLLLYYLSL